MTVAPLVASVASYREMYQGNYEELLPSTPTSCVDMLKEVAEGAVAGLFEDEDDWLGDCGANRGGNGGSPTSVMLRNIPNKYARSALISALLEQGFDACKFCNNLYLPMDAASGCNLGFCFLNFHRHQDALDFMNKFEGCRLPSAGSRKVCSVVWANRQGVFQHSNPPNATRQSLSPVPGDTVTTPPLPSASSDSDTSAPEFSCASGGVPCKVFVGGLSATTTETDLVNYFQQFGAVRECCIVTNRQTGTSRGFGFCEFGNTEAVHKVHLAQLKKPHAINGRVVSIRLYNFLQQTLPHLQMPLPPTTTATPTSPFFVVF